MSVALNVRVPAVLALRDVVGEMLRALCRHVERAEGCCGLETRVLSAYNEAFNNVTEHAYGPNRHGEVVVSVHTDTARFVLELQDNGAGFDFDSESADAPPPLDALDAGGMGLFIIRRAMTSVSYQRGATNILTMVTDLSECRAARAPRSDVNDEGSRC